MFLSFYLFQDILHNIIDGLTISTVYMLNNESGIILGISIFIEELFHQLADFGILY